MSEPALQPIEAGHKAPASVAVPDGWGLVDLSTLCTLQRGFDLTETTRVPGDVPVYSSSGLAYYHDKAMVVPPGIVTGRKGLLGKVYLIDVPFWPHDTTLWARDFRGNHPAFVALVLENFHLEKLDAATSVPTLNRNNLVGHLVAIPATRLEQRTIASALSDADDLIASLERLITKKRAIKQGMMQELLTGRTRLPGFDEAWRMVILENLGEFLKGRGIKRDEVRSSGVACIRYGEIYTTYRDYTSTTVSFVDINVAATALSIGHGDILFAGSGETKEEIGTCVAYIGEMSAVVGGDTIVMRGKGYDPTFLASLLNTPPVAAVKASAGQGDAVVHINSRALAAITVDLPSLAEQQAIAQVLRDADTGIAALERRIETTRDIKQGMMQELLTGRTRLPAEEDTP